MSIYICQKTQLYLFIFNFVFLADLEHLVLIRDISRFDGQRWLTAALLRHHCCFLFTFWGRINQHRRYWVAGLALEQVPLVGFECRLFTILNWAMNHFSEDTPKTVNVNSLVIIFVGQDDLWSPIPSRLNNTCHVSNFTPSFWIFQIIADVFCKLLFSWSSLINKIDFLRLFHEGFILHFSVLH